jgi:DNA-binding IclR family transcriptional regulator
MWQISNVPKYRFISRNAGYRKEAACQHPGAATGALIDQRRSAIPAFREGRSMAQTTKQQETPTADDNLKSLAKVMRVLGCFSTVNRSLSLTELCAATGYPRSTTHRLVSSMRDVGLLDQERQRDRYRLGLKLFELGNIVLANMDLHREALSQISGQIVHLALFDGRQAIVIHRANSTSDGATPLTLIEAAPVHCTSVGKAVLAFQPPEVIDSVIQAGLKRFTDKTITSARKLHAELAQIRRRGYAVDDGEHQPGLRCIGAPIRDNSGRVIAGVSVSGPAWKIPTAEIEGLAQIVMHHAAQISANL